jgi:dienelactone hydrolase
MFSAIRRLRCLAAGLVLLALLPADVAAATQRVTIRTDDGISLAATWYETGARSAPAVILLHMLHKSRLDWESVATRLAAEGIGALAIDLRGHGALVADDLWAYRFLRSKGNSIEGGTTEILKNIVAERVLGLPRG